MNNITPLFSSPLYQSVIPSQQQYKQTCDELSYDRSAGDNGWISIDQNVLDHFPQLLPLILHHLDEYIYNILQIKQNYYITNSWVNKHTKHDYLPQHSHANSIFTGIYYIQLPHNSGNILTLHQSPFIPSFVPGTIIPDTHTNNIYNSKQVDVLLQEGTLLLFPSHIDHSAPQSQSDHTRYALSFNLFLNGDFGTSTNHLHI